MATKTRTRTTTTEINVEELNAEILTRLFQGYDSYLAPGAIGRELSESGVNCGAEELGASLASLHREGFIDMTGMQGQTLDEIIVRFHLTSKGSDEATKGIRTHYLGDGCDPPHALGLEDLSLCHGLPGR